MIKYLNCKEKNSELIRKFNKNEKILFQINEELRQRSFIDIILY